MTNKQYFTWEEIKENNTELSMWVVAEGKVYDVTNFFKRHPGGSFLIKSKAGTDVTQHKKMHSTRVQKLWEKFHIGYVETHNTTKCLCLFK